MAKEKIAITADKKMVLELDRLVSSGLFANRSKAIQNAIQNNLEKIHKTRLAREILKLDPREEKELANETFKGEGEL